MVTGENGSIMVDKEDLIKQIPESIKYEIFWQEKVDFAVEDIKIYYEREYDAKKVNLNEEDFRTIALALLPDLDSNYSYNGQVSDAVDNFIKKR